MNRLRRGRWDFGSESDIFLNNRRLRFEGENSTVLFSMGSFVGRLNAI